MSNLTLYITDHDHLRAAYPALLDQDLDRLGLMHGMPFILANDGLKYPHDLNQFLRDLALDGVHAQNSWENYARDVLAFCNFLAVVYKGLGWREAGTHHLRHYREIRRGSSAALGDWKVSAKSWNRALVAIERLYRFGIRESLVTDWSPRSITDVFRNLRDREQGEEPVRCISTDDYAYFRNVGLRGMLPDGGDDKYFDTRYSARNVLYSDSLVLTGMRVEECSSLVTWDLPELGNSTNQSKFRLSQAVTKGRRSRDVYLPSHLHSRLENYRRLGRENCLRTVSHRRAPWLEVRRDGREKVRAIDAARSLSLNNLSVLERYRLAERNADGHLIPLGLWLSERGQMMQPDSWRFIFREAAKRCSDFGRPLLVTPHVLRHTFAVQLLRLLVKHKLGTEDWAYLEKISDMAVYKRLLGDPLRIVQRRLGHKSITSTYIYLTELDEVVDMTDEAIRQLDAVLTEDHPLEATPHVRLN